MSYEEMKKRAATRWGYVYLLKDAKTGWYKCGWTLRSVADRAKEINREFKTGMEWQVFTCAWCYNPPATEAMFHALFDEFRITDKREWFEFNSDEVPEGTLRWWFEETQKNAWLNHRNYHGACRAAYIYGRREGIDVGRFTAELDEDAPWLSQEPFPSRLDVALTHEPPPASIQEPPMPKGIRQGSRGYVHYPD